MCSSDLFSFGDSSTDSPFSIDMWVNMTDATKFRMVSKSGVTTREYYINTSSGDFLFFVLFDNTGGNYRYISSNETMTQYEGQWINIVGTYDGRGGTNANDGLNLYLNGSLMAFTKASAGTYVAMHNTTEPLLIGRFTETNDYANGQISNVKIYNRALTTQEIKDNYNALKSRFGIR